jgi:hypothetical protein
MCSSGVPVKWGIVKACGVFPLFENNIDSYSLLQYLLMVAGKFSRRAKNLQVV